MARKAIKGLIFNVTIMFPWSPQTERINLYLDISNLNNYNVSALGDRPNVTTKSPQRHHPKDNSLSRELGNEKLQK